MTFFIHKLRLSINSVLWGVLVFATPAYSQRQVTRARYLMGTLCEITASGSGASEAVTRAFEEIARLEQIMSDYRPDSELSFLNKGDRSAPVPISTDLWAVLTRAIKISADSSGAFDVTYASPAGARGWKKIELYPKNRAIRLPPGTVIDLGGIGKGYALDKAVVALRSAGIRSALLNFGGQVYALGAWPVEVAPPACAPDSDAKPLALRVKDASVSTSGDCERPGHIRDPRTGKSVRKKISVTVVAPTATEADAWDTPLYIRGLDNLPSTFHYCAIELEPTGPPLLAGDCSPYLNDKEKLQ